VKTGRLLKFRRPGGDVHAYLYREGEVVHAEVFVAATMSARPAAERFSGGTEPEVEARVRAWVDRHFPKAT
jgi:hypothetical protein